MVQFLCPNGHRIRCPDDQAGRAAKCPKCGVAFKVPAVDQPSTLATVAVDGGSTVLKAADASGVKAPPPKEPQIEFLCPNGHRLHGPAGMQGRPGQCPECGSKFRIPSYTDEISEEEELEQGIGMGRADQSEAGDGDSSVEMSEHDRLEADGPLSNDSDLSDEQKRAETGRSAGPHSWARMFAELWAQKAAGVVIEVCLQDGRTIVPEHFAGDSSGRHAIFAVKNDNGTYTLTAIAWESLARVVVGGLKILPLSIFRE